MSRAAYVFDGATNRWEPFSGPPGEPGPGLRILGSVASAVNLPAGGSPGDGWIVQDTGLLFLWDQTTGAWKSAGKIKGDKGDAGETLKISGAVPTAADLPTTPAPLTVYIAQDNSSLYIFDVNSTGAGVNAPTGWVNLGAIAGPKGEKGDRGDTGLTGAAALVRGSVQTAADLPATGVAGEIRLVEKTGHLYSWDDINLAWVDGGKIRVDGKAAFFGPAVPNQASLPYPGQPGEARIAEDTSKIYSWNSDTQTWDEVGVLKSVPDGTANGQQLVWSSGAWVTSPGLPDGIDEGDLIFWDATASQWIAHKSHLGYQDNITITPTVSDGGTLVYDEATDNWTTRKIKVADLADGPGAVAPANGDVLGFSTAQQRWVPTGVNNLVLPWQARTYLTGSLTFHDGEVWRASRDAQATDRPGDPGAVLTISLDPVNQKSRVGAVGVPGTYGVEDSDWAGGMKDSFAPGEYYYFDDAAVNSYPYTVKAGPFVGYILERNAKFVWTNQAGAGVLGWMVVQPSQWDGTSPTVLNTPSTPAWKMVGPETLGHISNVDTVGAASGDLLVFDGTDWNATKSTFANHSEVNLRIEQFAIGIARTTSVVSITNTPVTTPSIAFYIVGKNPTGEWVGHTNQVAYWAPNRLGSFTWHFHSPLLDETHLVEDQAKLFTFDGVGWVAAAVSTGTGVPDGSNDGELLVWKDALSRWEPELPQAVSSAGAIIGTVVHSLLTEGQFITASGANSSKWRLCDGRSCVGTAYQTLTGQANVPDLRGAYFRMAGNNSTNTSWQGGDLGSFSEDTTRMPRNTPFTTASNGIHQHETMLFDQDTAMPWGMGRTVSEIKASDGQAGAEYWEDIVNAGNGAEGPERAALTQRSGSHNHTVNGGDTETKPKTYAVNYFMYVG